MVAKLRILVLKDINSVQKRFLDLFLLRTRFASEKAEYLVQSVLAFSRITLIYLGRKRHNLQAFEEEFSLEFGQVLALVLELFVTIIDLFL